MADKTLRGRLIAARKKMNDPRLSGSNPHFKSKFVPLDEVLAACVEPLLDEGLFLSQGMADGDLLTTVHDAGPDGEQLCLGAYPIPANNDPQKFMAAVTYAARKSLMLAFGFRGDEDDDGNTAAAKPEPDNITKAWERVVANVKANGTDDDVKEAMGTTSPTESYFRSLSPNQRKAVESASKG